MHSDTTWCLGWSELEKRRVTSCWPKFMPIIPKQECTTRMMLGTWLLELYLSKYNQLEDAVSAGSLGQDPQDIIIELNLLGDELKQFLDTYKVRNPMNQLAG
jgi:hypothetical protein